MIIYDCEIVKCIPPRNFSDMDPELEYCSGWEDFPNMGISVICAYDYTTNEYRVFLEDNFDMFASLVLSHDRIVGFNSARFDNKLIEGSGLFDDTVIHKLKRNTYDILREIWIALDLDPDNFHPRSHGGLGLDKVCRSNIDMEKRGHGALAPELWQKGKIGEVIDYCLGDVKLTKELLDLISDKGEIINPKNNLLLTVRRP